MGVVAYNGSDDTSANRVVAHEGFLTRAIGACGGVRMLLIDVGMRGNVEFAVKTGCSR